MFCKHTRDVAWARRVRLVGEWQSSASQRQRLPRLRRAQPLGSLIAERYLAQPHHVLNSAVQITSHVAIEMSCIRSPLQAGVRLSSRSRTQILSISRAFSTVQDAPTFSTPIPAAFTAPSSPLQDAVNASGPRMDWKKDEISQIYNSPLIELQYAAVSSLPTGLRLQPKRCFALFALN